MSLSTIMSLRSWFRDRLMGGDQSDVRMALALALTDEVLSSARDMRHSIEPHAMRQRGPFMTMWRERLETEQKRRATYIRSID